MDFLDSLVSPIVGILSSAVDFFYGLTASVGMPSYGVAIILMTIAIKMVLYPLTVKQIKSMKAMQDLQPKMKRIQEMYADNKELQAREMQKLYSEEGFNPMAGCLPLLIQMPILMAMFYALRDFNYQGDPSFLWVANLSDPDPTHIMVLISAATTYFATAQTTDDSNQQMKGMSYIMPLFIGWMSWSFSAGLVLYWSTMNLVQMAQQWWIYRGINAEQEKIKAVKKAEKKLEKLEKKSKKVKLKKEENEDGAEH